MELTQRERELIKEAMIGKFKLQTDLLNRKRHRETDDPVKIKWVELEDLLNRFRIYKV